MILLKIQQKGEITENVGESVLVGRSASEMELARTLGIVITLLHLLRFPPSSQEEAFCGCIFGQI